MNYFLREPTVLAQLIQSYARSGQLEKGKQLHARLIYAGGIPSTFVANHLLHFYSKCGRVTDAVNLFDQLSQPNIVSWTALISGFSHNKRCYESAQTFSSMHAVGVSPTEFAISSTVQAVASLGFLDYGKQLHSLSLKLGFCAELFVGSNLVDMYSKCGVLVDACKVFNEMPDKDVFAWNALIDGHVKSGDFRKAVGIFKNIVREAVCMDQHILCSGLGACGGLMDYILGKSLHAMIIKLGFESEVFIGNALTDVYSKCRDMGSSSRVVEFHSKGWNVVSSTSLIDGYVGMDHVEKALSTYVELQRQCIVPNEFTFSSMLKGCANCALLDQGMQLHAQVIKTSFVCDPLVSASLVDMYGKCGLHTYSKQAFGDIKQPIDVTWNMLVGVLAQHGRGKEAVEVFNTMISRGVRPNDVTFVNLLTACSHSGLVNEGMKYFYSMHDNYRVEPKAEHYSCIIDMLGRAGRLHEVEEFIRKMPFEPNAFAWCSLLSACKILGNKKLGEFAAAKLMRLEPENSGVHILLSNIYEAAKQWEDVKAVRKLMKDNNVRKLPGFSWIDVNSKTHTFGAEDWSHPQKEEIYQKLEELSQKIKAAGYVPRTSCVSSNVDKRSKERILYFHSERIAVAFALLNVPAIKPIIVKKNLRVCVDCHSAIKLMSKVEGREIILRDNARFHHFSDGLCSCGDYW